TRGRRDWELGIRNWGFQPVTCLACERGKDAPLTVTHPAPESSRPPGRGTRATRETHRMDNVRNGTWGNVTLGRGVRFVRVRVTARRAGRAQHGRDRPVPRVVPCGKNSQWAPPTGARGGRLASGRFA